MIDLLVFEFFKLFRQAKTYLALLAINAFPIIALLVSALAMVRARFYLETMVPLDTVQEVFGFLLIIHLKAFNWIMPFFLVLVVADMVSGEMARGTIKTLLLRPVTRFEVLGAKLVAILGFLFLSVSLGALLLQGTLLLLKWTIARPAGVSELFRDSGIIPAGALGTLFLICLAVNMTIVSFCLAVSVATSSSTLAMIISLLTLLFLYAWAILDPLFAELFPRLLLGTYTEFSRYAFTYSIERVTDLDMLNSLIRGVPSKISLGHHLGVLTAYSTAFLACAFGVFQRRDILH